MAGMGQAELPPDEELGRLALLLARRFINRWDMYPQQIPDGRYVTIHEPLTSSHLLAHLRGEMTLGTYILDRQSQARFVVLDADEPGQWQSLKAIAAQIAEEHIPSYLERSSRGGHLWLFLASRVSGRQARLFGQHLLAAHNLSGVELFPKQAELTTGPGSLIRLPFGVHLKTGQRYGFYYPTGEPVAPTLREQIHCFTSPQTIPEAAFEAYSVTIQPEVEAFLRPQRGSEEPSGELVSERIKSSTSVQDFISRYVTLNANGQGLCPFHDDHHPSFSVNEEAGYWQCFAGCGGGSIVDFWMRWRDIDFTQAVRELAEMLLG
jgi:hypothetical protein